MSDFSFAAVDLEHGYSDLDNDLVTTMMHRLQSLPPPPPLLPGNPGGANVHANNNEGEMSLKMPGLVEAAMFVDDDQIYSGSYLGGHAPHHHYLQVHTHASPNMSPT